MNLICIKAKEGNMKRLEIHKNLLQHARPRGQAKLESILGFLLFIMICIFTCGTNNRNSNDPYMASIFATDFTTDQILHPNVALHIQNNHNSFTLFDLMNNSSISEKTVKDEPFIKDIQFVIQKNFLKDVTHFDINTYYFIKAKLIWNSNIKKQRNNSNFTNGIVNLSPNVSSPSDRQILWNPNLYNNLDIPPKDEYKSGTLSW